MQVVVSNNISIKNPSKEILSWCNQHLKLNNPEYAKKVRMGFWVGNTSQHLYLYEVHGDEILLPYGTLKQIQPLIKDSAIMSDFKPWVNIDYGERVPLYPYQEQAVKAAKNGLYGILQSKAGSGKGLPLDATIYTPLGKKRMGDLQVGDEVLNTYGTISRVTNIFDRGEQPCFKITFTDGHSVVCDSDHLWSVVTENGKHLTVSSQWLFENDVVTQGDRLKYRIPTTSPVFFDKREYPLNPWLFGFLLGDGYFGNEITFSTSEQDLLNRVKSFYKPNVIKTKGEKSVDYRIVDGGETKRKLIELGIWKCHSWEKFIPDCYKYNDRGVRLAILQGLIDSDGSVIGTNITMTSTSKRLIDDLLEIVESLGGVGHYISRQTSYTYDGVKKKGRVSYRLYFKLPNSYTPCNSDKHLSQYQSRTKYSDVYRKIVSIEPCESRITRCITVDSTDHLFLTDHFIPTHNTQMGIALIKEWGRRALWLTHTSDLLSQSKARAERYMDSSLIGTITEGKVNIGQGITFATIQTMCKLDLSQYKDMWDVIIVDECHRVCGSPTQMTMFAKVLNSLSARHKYGLSATVHRADGMIQATFALIGDVVYTVPDEAVADKVMQVGVMPVGTGIKLTPECLNTDGTLNYAKLINYLTNCFTRNICIIDELIDQKGKSCLVLSDRLEHLEKLINMLPDDMRSQAAMISGKMTTKKGKAEREQAIEDMRIGKKKYLFATYSLAREGLDIPRLECLYMASPVKDYSVVVQSIGRIARTFECKSNPICYDFVDSIKMTERMFKQRLRHYKKEGCYICEEPTE